MSLALILLILVGCGGLPTRGTPTPTLAPFRPAPPLPATPTLLTNPADLVLPLSTPVCLDNLTFLSDVTIPDGTEVEPNSTLDKRWEVQNSGNCNWDERYRLRLIAGPAMQAAEEQALFPARSGTKAIIQVLFQAPAEPGQYRSAWQAYNAEGQPFGDVIFIDIVVK